MVMVMVMVLAAACGGGGGNNGDDTPGDGAVDTPPDMPPGPPKKIGVVGAFEETLAGAGSFTGVLAQMIDGTASGTPDRVEGPCLVHFLAGETAMLVSAGTITVTRNADVVTLVPDGTNTYAASLRQGLIYKGGDALAVAAAGATVPAFSGNVSFPAAIAVTDPTVFPAKVKDGFAVAWTGAGAVRVQLAQGGNVRITCDFTSGTSGMVPAAALSDLVPGNQQAMQITLLIGTHAATALTAGDFDITVEALNAEFAAIGFAQ